jgi:MHS family alpha-ketoglutarate permease-like MFS transporter
MTTETVVFTKSVQPEAQRHSALREVFFTHTGAVFRVLGMACAGNLLFYSWLVSYASYVHLLTSTPLRTTIIGSIISITIGLIITPFVGILADKIGRRPVLMGFAFGSALYAWPSVHFLHANMTIAAIVMVQTPALLLLSGFNATVNTAIAEQFPAAVRATGTGVSYAISVALFGGTAPYVFADFHRSGLDNFSWIYILVMCLISGVTFLTMKETKDITI